MAAVDELFEIEAAQKANAFALKLAETGRGYGKTRAAAKAVNLVAKDPHARIALVASSAAEARRMALAVMAESKSATYRLSYAAIEWSNGAVATLYSAREPESLWGTEHGFAWLHRAGDHEEINTVAMTLRQEPGLFIQTFDWDHLEF